MFKRYVWEFIEKTCRLYILFPLERVMKYINLMELSYFLSFVMYNNESSFFTKYILKYIGILKIFSKTSTLKFILYRRLEMKKHFERKIFYFYKLHFKSVLSSSSVSRRFISLTELFI